MMNSKIQKAENGKNAGSAKKSVQVAVFENPEFGTVRTTIDEKGEPWFCAKDLCDALGYKKASEAVRQHVRYSDTVKRGVTRTVKNRYGVCEGKLKIVQMIFVNESGFYALVLGSKLASAVKFKDWVTSVVLPQIRKTGGYIPVHEGESEEETIRNAEEILRATLKKKEELLEQQKKLLRESRIQLAESRTQLEKSKVLLEQKTKLIGEQDEEIRRLNGVVDEQVVNIARKGENIIHLEHQVDGLMPKAIYSDNVLDSVSCFTTTQVAKELGITAQELNRSLCSLHVQYYQSGQYMLYAEYAHMGLAKSRTKYRAFMAPAGDGTKREVGRVVTSTYLVWTEKGKRYFSKVLTDGPISRINFCTIPERLIGEDIPIYGNYDDEFRAQLRPYIENLCKASGLVDCPEAFSLAMKLKDENAEFSRLSQNRIYENFTFRGNVIGYLKACVLYVANGFRWEPEIEEFIRWSEQYDLYCKMRFFEDGIKTASTSAEKSTSHGPSNLLQQLPDEFMYQQAVEVRQKNGLSADGTKNMLYAWAHRGYIERRKAGNQGGASGGTSGGTPDGSYSSYSSDCFIKLKFRKDGGIES